MIRHMLTTVDNPYDPFDQFDLWFAYDVGKGYNSSGLLALLGSYTSDLSEAIRAESLEHAIDRVVELNPLGIHRKVSKFIEDSSD
jgi:hypothetical protein